MKVLFKYIILLIIPNLIAFGQGKPELKIGTVTYQSSQNVYVRFDNTNGISIEDTLLIKKNNNLIKCIVVKYLSSSSAAGVKVCEEKLENGDLIYAQTKSPKKDLVTSKDISAGKNVQIATSENIDTEFYETPKVESEIKGKLSISSYSNFSNMSNRREYQRWRYLFSLTAKNIEGLPLTLNNYITFSYRTDQWNLVKENVGRALRIYELSVDYDFSTKTNITVGRKNNPNVSNLGSIDGVQFETRLGDMSAGLLIGSRPNYADYGFNYKMFQYGAYLSRKDTIGTGFMRNTIGAFNQTNDFKTDRRFLYIQHSNNTIKNINIFASSEIDIYKRKSGVPENTFSLTSLFLSARFRPSRVISFSVSYDARKNVVYYETYKNYADSLLESETRQGLRLRTTFRPLNYMTIGLHYGYRFRNSDQKPTNNFGGYVGYNRLPFINTSINVSYNRLNTAYLEGNIISVRAYKYLVHGLLNAGIAYKIVRYDYKASNYSLKQNIVNFDLTFQIFRKIFMSANFEGTYEDKRVFNRIYFNLTARF